MGAVCICGCSCLCVEIIVSIVFGIPIVSVPLSMLDHCSYVALLQQYVICAHCSTLKEGECQGWEGTDGLPPHQNPPRLRVAEEKDPKDQNQRDKRFYTLPTYNRQCSFKFKFSCTSSSWMFQPASLGLTIEVCIRTFFIISCSS